MSLSRHPLAGMAALPLGIACFVVNDALMKAAVRDLPIAEALFLRGGLASAALLAFIHLSGLGSRVRLAFARPVVIRALWELFALSCFFVALTRMPMADANAILQVAPLMLIVAAAVLHGDRLRPLQIGLVLGGFAGTLLIVKPGTASFVPAGLFSVAAAVFAVARDLKTREIDPATPAVVVIFGTMAVGAVGLGLAALTGSWHVPAAAGLALIAGAAGFLTAGHFLLFLAFKLEKPARLAPLLYFGPVAALAAGFAFFREVPDAVSLMGMALIVVAGILSARGGTQRDGAP